MSLTIDQLNAATPDAFVALLDGTYEHSPWIAERAAALRPFTSLAHLKHALVTVVRAAGEAPQLALIRAHPELAGKAMVSKTLTAESTNEQGKAGLTDCTPAEFAQLLQLNADYNAKFGFPFILAVRGPRGLGLNRHQIIATFERRLHGTREFEFAECLRNIHPQLPDPHAQTLRRVLNRHAAILVINKQPLLFPGAVIRPKKVRGARRR